MDKKRHASAAFARGATARPAAEREPAGEKSAPHEQAPKLGEILVAQGQITREQLAIALERQRASGRRLGEELIRAGFVKRGAVSRALRIQRRTILGAMMLVAASLVPRIDAASAPTGEKVVTAAVLSELPE